MDKTDVGDWLAGLGFGRYTQIFAENAIGADVLSDLSETDLEKLGIPLGDRKRLLKAIAARAENHATAPAVTAPGQAERRQLSVMFTDLVGSTALSARLDPEDLREVIGVYHRCVAETVSKFGGFVAKYMGDGVLVYFGYPQAHEDDAERAVRAGLALIEAVDTLGNAATQELQVRIGIGTGPVIVGDLIGRGEAQERGVVGETPNLAARLQAIAEPNSVVIALSTRRLVGNLFEYHDLGAIAAKGFSEPLSAFEVLGESGVESRFEAFHPSALAPLVGREEEIELLLRRWARAKRGEGQAVLLSGEPGIGKSRIAAEALERLQREPHTRLRYFCSPHHQASALHPFINQLEHAVGFERDDTPDRKLDRLEALLAQASRNVTRDAALMADQLSIPSGNRYQLPDLSPQKRKEEILTALLAQLDGLAARLPVLMIFEDAHWIDPTSLELLERIIDRIQILPVLLIVTARPEFAPPWTGRPQVTVHPLNRFTRREGVAVIERVTGGRSLPKEVEDQIIARTDGVPLFIEELTKAILESGVLQSERDRFVLTAPLPTLAIPTTLHASLMARLDRLAPVRKSAEIGAAIGREFSHELIAAVSNLSEKELREALDQLVASELVYRRGTPPDAVYTFKHVLVQEAAYSTLLRGARQQLHARIARILQERAEQYEILAHHFSRAEEWAKAVQYLRQAGAKAFARSANREAVANFEQALTALTHLPETRETLEQAIDLRFDLRPALFAIGDLQRLTEHLRDAERLAQALGDQLRLGRVSLHKSHYFWSTGHAAEAHASAENARAIAETLGDLPLQVGANHYLGAVCLTSGNYHQAETFLHKVVHLLGGDRSHDRCGLTGFPAAMARGWLAWALAERGAFDQGIVYGQEGLRLAEALDHPYSWIAASWGPAHLYRLRGEISHAIRLLERALALCRDSEILMLSGTTAGFLGFVYVLSGRVAEGLPLLSEAQESEAQYQTLIIAHMGEAYLLANRIDEAIAFAARALTLARERGQRGYEAYASRLLGEIAAHPGSPDAEAAEGYCRQAMALADELGMRPLVAHCHQGLAKLYHCAGKRQEAQEHFVTATTRYREMNMRFWLEKAEAEMPELG